MCCDVLYCTVLCCIVPDAGAGCYYLRGIMSHIFTPEMGKVLVAAANQTLPKGVQHIILIDMMGGGKSQEPELAAATALPSRPNFWFILLCQWDPAVTGQEQGRSVAAEWVRSLWKQLFELASVVPNGEGTPPLLDNNHSGLKDLLADTLQMGQQGTGPGPTAKAMLYGANTDRLQAVKTTFDPLLLFGEGYRNGN